MVFLLGGGYLLTRFVGGENGFQFCSNVDSFACYSNGGPLNLQSNGKRIFVNQVCADLLSGGWLDVYSLPPAL